jgi:hypothetical protein
MSTRFSFAHFAAGLLLAHAVVWTPMPALAADDAVSDILNEWANPCPERIERFTHDLGQLVLRLDRLPEYATEIGWEAVQRLPDLGPEQQQLFCETLDGPAGRSLDLAALSAEFEVRTRASGCIGVNTYLGILGLRTVLDGIQVGLQAFCDGSSCPSVFPPEPPTCGIACAIVPPFGIIGEIISTRMDIADKCANLTHEEQMALMRSASTATVDDISSAVLDVLGLVQDLVTNVVRQVELLQTDDAIVEAFDGLGRSAEPETGTVQPRVQNGPIGPALDQLRGVVEAGRIEQQQFERRAVRARLESALLTGATYSRMLRPRAFDGVLEEIRELVAQRIQAVAAAGGDTSLALQQFRSGDIAFNNAEYRAALTAYRNAYAALGGVPQLLRSDTHSAEGDSR